MLSNTTDSLDRRLGLGEDLGGLILLAVAGTLPEIAIVASASLAGHLELAVGNLIGGIAIQTLVLVLLDFSSGPRRPLSFLVGSLTPVLEALLVIVCWPPCSAAPRSASTSVGGVSPTSIAAVVLWLAGLWVVNRVSKDRRGRSRCPAAGRAATTRREPHPRERRPFVRRSTAHVVTLFGLASAVTLGAGVALQSSGNVLADRIGLQGAIFGATVLAAATALPEISSGIAAVRLGDHQLAVGDILGGNSFQLDALPARRPPRRDAGDRRRPALRRLARRCRAAADRDRGSGRNRPPEAHLPLARDRLDRAGGDLRGRDRALPRVT